jgi:hypothetical protein
LISTCEKTSKVKESTKDFLERLKAIPKVSEEERRSQVAQNYLDMAPVLKDLYDNGFIYDSIHSLRHSEIVYGAAIPILLKWLPKIHNYDIKEEIVRTLSVPWAKPEAAPAMVGEFLSADQSEDSYKWAIGNGLSIVADDSVADDIIKLATDRRHGTSRQMLAIALGNMRDPRVFKVLVDLLKDSDVCGHAVMGLGKLGAGAARPYLEPFLKHEETWIRNEAKKAIARIDRSAAKGANKLPSKRIQ